MSAEYCSYCGSPRGDRISCCQEVHFMTAEEFKEYTGEWPDDGEDHEEDEYCTVYHCPGDCGLKGHK